ncbi:hypothetical protein PLICRDRAFT_181082 [Plicaturopsis crispa FD-325 SS-3]|uniref:Unplaced genomic scaffold PLICRscaffold_140, whole genome shotgun sequence n=1 Tax=Plicaturopsis crispa FD-325 SS-3 TaxID=944288 RepID=A0A0C9SJX6_PLICR|nr:hypothetical protein PLICRDRAFT_181082 [Plicaturopsis crispa FD-325 SS-3]
MRPGVLPGNLKSRNSIFKRPADNCAGAESELAKNAIKILRFLDVPRTGTSVSANVTSRYARRERAITSEARRASRLLSSSDYAPAKMLFFDFSTSRKQVFRTSSIATSRYARQERAITSEARRASRQLHACSPALDVFLFRYFDVQQPLSMERIVSEARRASRSLLLRPCTPPAPDIVSRFFDVRRTSSTPIG